MREPDPNEERIVLILALALALFGWVILAFNCTGCDPDYFGRSCAGTPCYSGPAGTEGHGQCHVGTSSCTKSGQFLHCDGEVLPSPDLCDGINNRCAENWTQLEDGTEEPWNNAECGYPRLGICRPGHLYCWKKGMTCNLSGAYGARGPEEEDCSGRDLDCDGIPNDIKSVVCYDGDPNNLIHPGAICRAGVTRCVGSHVSCVGQVLPQAEPDDSAVDLNCDGELGACVRRGVDIVVVWDRTGVLYHYLPMVQDALTAFAISHRDPIYQFAVVDEPGWPIDAMDSPKLGLPFTGSLLFSAYVQSWTNVSWGSGNEWPNDALVNTCGNGFGLAWRPEATHIIWSFQDDDDYFDDPFPTSASLDDAIMACAARPARVTTFSSNTYSQWGSSWTGYQTLAVATQGKVYPLDWTATATGILDVLTKTGEAALPCQ